MSEEADGLLSAAVYGAARALNAAVERAAAGGLTTHVSTMALGRQSGPSAAVVIVEVSRVLAPPKGEP